MRHRGAGRTAAKRGSRPGGEEQGPAAPEPAQDPVEQIRDLAELREQGILTEEEFAAEKRKLLGF